jgi:hypothetical protein
MIKWIRFQLVKVMYPVLKLVEKLGKPEPKVTGEFYYQVEGLIKPGDILLSKEDLKLVNVLIPGFWSHAAIYVGDRIVVEAVGRGVVKTPLCQWILGKDHVAVLRFKDATEDQSKAAAELSCTLVGQPYDYSFSSGNKAWYCAEVVWYAYDKSMGGFKEFTLRETLGAQTVTPSDFFNASDKVIELALFGGPECPAIKSKRTP